MHNQHAWMSMGCCIPPLVVVPVDTLEVVVGNITSVVLVVSAATTRAVDVTPPTMIWTIVEPPRVTVVVSVTVDTG